jgi:hypothetical protein
MRELAVLSALAALGCGLAVSGWPLSPTMNVKSPHGPAASVAATNAGSDIFLRSKAGSKIRIVCGLRNSHILRTKGAKVQLNSFMGFDGLAYCWSMIFSKNGSHFSGSCSNIHAP